MSYEIKLLDLIDIDLESSFLVLARNMGVRTRVKTWGFLILGGNDPILVDTGARDTEIMERLGMTAFIDEEQRLENQLAERMDTQKLVGDIVTHWHRFGVHRQTVIFASGVAHSIHLRDEFRKAGIEAEHIDVDTPNDKRDEILKQLANGKTKLVTNAMVLTEGWDCPEVSCLVLARPTKSMGLYCQMCGRGLRPSAGKADLIVLDHAGAVFEHGFIDEPVLWTLDKSRRAINPKHAARRDSYFNRLCDCPKCGALRTAGEACRSCGYLPQRGARDVEVIEGELAAVGRNRQAAANIYTDADKRFWHAALWHIANERARARAFNSRGWVYHKYLERFGHKPPWGNPAPVPPSAEVRSWVRSRDIAYAKAMSKQRGAA
jgi:superfamily II DNA or RNA helicase